MPWRGSATRPRSWCIWIARKVLHLPADSLSLRCPIE
jgi:hypothetical protein